MIRLSVNINKVALLRNARGKQLPDPIQVALDCIAFGADGITVHPRPDERHTRRSDVYALSEALDAEFNVEGFPTEDFLSLIEEVKPDQCTLVPDPPDVLTSNAGWDTKKHRFFLLDVVNRLKAAGVRTSLFLEPDLDLVDYAREIGTDRIELYTEAFAEGYATGKPETIEPYARAAGYAHEIGLGINAGHDLNLDNIGFFAEKLPMVSEVSIGHALISEALYLGLRETIARYQKKLGKP